MNIKWAYYLIAGIYVLLVILRGINYLNEAAYKKENTNYNTVFSIKKDFFTTVTLICIVVTLAINTAALAGGKSLNTSSMVITLLVIGFTILNSFNVILFSEEAGTVCLLGYTLVKGDLESLKKKTGKNKEVLNMTFNREIESYNYAKIVVFGEKKQALSGLLEKMVQTKED